MDLDAAVQDLHASSGVPGVAAVQVSSAGAHATAVAGVRRFDDPAPVEPGDVFHLGSNTKALTAMLAALAVENGAIGWDTPVREVLGAGEATLRELLTHASGLAPYTDDEEFEHLQLPDGSAVDHRAAFARAVLAEPAAFVRGSEHRYSNAGYAVAAAMVESVTGQPWESALDSRIFRPLGIRGVVGWPIAHSTAAPLGHWDDEGAYRVHDPAEVPYTLLPAIRPAGDTSLSVGDYGIFLADQLAGLQGHGVLGPEAAYRAVHTSDASDGEGGLGFALGWGVTQRPGGPVSQHTGSAGTFYAVAALQPESDRGIAVLANSARDSDIAAVNAVVKAFLAES
jgi:CubicO group peptidase (beta-lactamase class C family)